MANLLVALDLCDTLVKGNTTFIFLDHLLKNNSIFKIYRRLSRWFPFKVFFKVLSLVKFDANRKIAILFLKGIKKSVLQKNANFLVQHTFVFDKEIVTLINYCNANNIPVYIVSASLDVIAEAVASKFGIHYISSCLDFNANVCTGTLKQDLLYTKEMLFTEGSKKYSGVDLEQLVFVSDNVQDISLLKKARFGFGFYTDKNFSKFTSNQIIKFEAANVVATISNYQDNLFNNEKTQ
ncbi:TPA: haloacid dehalogenase-like hydrolase [Citrobacter freundii]|uniref:HAD family hydrolase n=1 Tax=Citrobacter freundii TaxID=546 RepID=UPI0028BF4777|nr:HAD family hydrolase [Citrobacter freundii]MDT7344426.1 HAD family hydrolase [Citrobacter freundii]WIJ96598.1 haloacid dehalogenase-like hydrolase [Citrobacter freundii]HCL5681737.1 haloacid dehalogenase-like hydrolase [Citrobacter freundii]HCL6563560.1 haloacid dehalogenase-like hydrolase [Citrobacter freundii]HCT4274314.1 haloacid dehalogenase-like hydrolase [Citrobacter freundii]